MELNCNKVEDIPSIEKIQQILSSEDNIRLHFPASYAFDAKLLVSTLQAAFPSGYRVWHNHFNQSNFVEIYKVIDDSVIHSHAPLILNAIDQFLNLADDLVTRLAQHHECDLAVVNNRHFVILYDLLFQPQEGAEVLLNWLVQKGHYTREFIEDWSPPAKELSTRGMLDEQWRYVYHGGDWCFTNVKSGQIVDVVFGFKSKLDMIDPFFFERFIETTPDLENLRSLFTGFRNSCVIFEVLSRDGYLTSYTD